MIFIVVVVVVIKFGNLSAKPFWFYSFKRTCSQCHSAADLLTTYSFELCLVTSLTVKTYSTHTPFIQKISNQVESPGEGEQLLS